MYYLRTKAARDAVKFTVNTEAEKAPQPTAAQLKEQAEAELACSLDNPDDCEMCSG